ncbi:MAG: hypothetical protein LQ346_005432 [Caloplaca aetnensis]|nr:MAG: hypothetical protein LQ346_005432 [Caloplaca aetnensis]
MERIRKSPVLDGEVQGSNPKIMLGADKLTPAEDFEGMNGLVDVDDDDDNEYQKLLKKPSPVLKGGLQTTTLPLHPDSRVETSFFGNDRFLDSPGQLTTEASGRKRRRRRQRQIRHRGFQFQLDSKAPKKTSR